MYSNHDQQYDSRKANVGHGCGAVAGQPIGFPGGSLHTDPELLRRMLVAKPGEAVPCSPPPNTINRPAELDVIKDRLRHVCEQAANVRLRVRYTNDKLFGPSIEKSGPEDDPVAEGPALNTICCLINEASRMLSDTQAELARLEML